MERDEEKTATQVRGALRQLSRYSREVHKIKKGDIVVVTTGDYSDYEVEAIIVALKDIDLLKEQVDLIVNFENLIEGTRSLVMPLEHLVPNLIRDGKAAPLEYIEYHRDNPWIRIED